MTAPSPLADASGPVAFSIQVEGKEIDSAWQVDSIDTRHRVNKVPKARLVLFDGSPAEGDFPISAGKTFLPGNRLKIAAAYGDAAKKVLFEGVISGQGIEIDETRGSKLLVEATSEAIKMTLERKNAVFEKVTDSTLIGKLIAASGLGKKITATKVTHPEVVQYYASDWDLMVTRAELNGFVVSVEGRTVTVGPPDTSATPVLGVTYGEDVLDLQADLDAATQLSKSAIQSATWDVATQKVVDAAPGTVSVTEQGDLTSEKLADVFKVKRYNQQTGGPIEQGSLKDWSSAELLKSRLSKIRGWVRFQGSARAKVGATLEMAGLGPRFNGRAWLSGVHHSIHQGRWLTTVDFGLSPRWFTSETPDIAAPDASGLLPPVKGLQTGVVKKVAKDPGGEYRVLVGLPLLRAGSKGVWARLGTFYASSKAGAFFYPEPGDEVVVGFMNEDPRYPVILGSVYSKKHVPPETPEQRNDRKALVTRSKLEISFDDKDKILEIRTPGKHVIKMDDKSGAISIKDSNRNTVSLSKGGIALDSASNIKITAKGNITIQAGANLKAAAKANATMEGLQVAHKAKAKFSAKGNAMAELKAGGILTVRGALVKIN